MLLSHDWFMQSPYDRYAYVVERAELVRRVQRKEFEKLREHERFREAQSSSKIDVLGCDQRRYEIVHAADPVPGDGPETAAGRQGRMRWHACPAARGGVRGLRPPLSCSCSSRAWPGWQWLSGLGCQRTR
jgi:hypothetical protein